MEKQKPINIKIKLAGGKDSVIPAGITEELKCSVIDGLAVFHFNDGKITRRFILQTKDKTTYKAEYSERTQKGVIYYPDMKQMEIVKKIRDDLKELEA